MNLETGRLILDTWQVTDWTALRPIATDPEVMRYITGGVPWTDEQIQAFVDRQMKLYCERGFCPAGSLLAKPDGETIGFCGVGFVQRRRRTQSSDGGWRARTGAAAWPRKPPARHSKTRLNARDFTGSFPSPGVPGEQSFDLNLQKLGLTFECEFESEGVRLVRYAIERRVA